MNNKNYFRNKKITIMGLGLLGRGVGDAKFLAEQGAELIVTDLKTEEELQESIEKLKSFPNIQFVFGEHRLEDFKNRDYILKAAGVPLNSPYIAEAQNNNIPIKMSASWFMELSNVPTVGVTGTRGKTTVTYMLKDILTGAGMNVLLGGNIRGVSTLALLDDITKDSIGLFELDSWQCQGLRDSHISPNIAVFTSFMEDHMTYYAHNSEQYLDDKAQIFLHQKPEDTLILEEGVVGVIEKYKNRIQAHTIISKEKSLPKNVTLQVLGSHNTRNAACAYNAAKALGVDEDSAVSALNTFTGVSGRLELVREASGVKYYNDTTATTPEATITALSALGSEKNNIVLIMGGNDKELKTEALMSAVQSYTKHVVLLDGTGTQKIKEEMKNVMIYHNNLQSAFDEAVSVAEPGDIVLLSPAFTSFGLFKNEYDRGDQFVALVKEL